MSKQTITIGRIATIPIRLHWSWLLIFALLMAALRPVYAVPLCGGLASCGLDLALAALMASLLGVSVLLHELGHALVARRLLVPVESITLFAFGGTAEVKAESPTPEAELLIAVAGPLVSLLIAGLAGAFWWSRATAAPSDAVAALAAHLAAANALLALFNLLPGYPMDGGRVLRATLWFLNDDVLPATRTASRAGQACGWLLGLGGLAIAVGARAPLVAVWSALTGLFLYRMAGSSYRQILVQSTLRNVRVDDLMQRRLRTVTEQLTLEQFVARYVLGQAETGFAVVEPAEGQEERLVGMMTLANLRRFTTSQWSTVSVSEAMTPAAQVRTLTPETTALEALEALHSSPDGLLPVIKGNPAGAPLLVGLLRRRDLTVYVQVQLARRR